MEKTFIVLVEGYFTRPSMPWNIPTQTQHISSHQTKPTLTFYCYKLFVIYMYLCMYVCIYVCIYVCLYVCMYVWINGWMDGWIDGWMDGWMDRYIHIGTLLNMDMVFKTNISCDASMWC